MTTKICSKCKHEKEVCEFYTDKTKSDGYYSRCKECKNNYFKTRTDETKKYLESWRKNNNNYAKKFRENNPNYVKNYYHKNKNKMIDSVKKHREKNKESLLPKQRESSLKYYYNNKEIIKEKNKTYRINNRDKRNEFVKNKRLNNPIYRLTLIVRNRIRTFLKLKNLTKTNKTFNIIGCSPEFLKEHLEQQFTKGMSWDLMGKYIHIDHIIPLSSAKTEEKIYELCHYTNLQPLWAKDNLRKSNKILL